MENCYQNVTFQPRGLGWAYILLNLPFRMAETSTKNNPTIDFIDIIFLIYPKRSFWLRISINILCSPCAVEAKKKKHISVYSISLWDNILRVDLNKGTLVNLKGNRKHRGVSGHTRISQSHSILTLSSLKGLWSCWWQGP